MERLIGLCTRGESASPKAVQCTQSLKVHIHPVLATHLIEVAGACVHERHQAVKELNQKTVVLTLLAGQMVGASQLQRRTSGISLGKP
jgi:hypothetical protein